MRNLIASLVIMVRDSKCDNYMRQWWVEFDDELSWVGCLLTDKVLPDKWKLRELE